MMVGLLIAGIWGCGGDEPQPAGDLADIPYVPQAYLLPELPYFFPDLSVPADNPLTVDGVELGRYLFYDPILSVDSTLSCAGCHRQELGFTDGLALSEGVGQTIGIRNAKPLANVGFFEKGLFWDGRVQTLEELALHPIEDPLEMKNTLENLIADLQVHPEYPAMFRKAFGIADREEISAPLIAKALGQFTRTLVSFNAKYDYANWDRGPETQFFSPSELRGQKLFNREPIDPDEPHPGCSHCHVGPLVSTNEYANNGLDEALEPVDFPDPGLGGITGKPSDFGKFRVPSLRNIALTAPYMHDGRFATLEEVLDHYSSGGHYADNLDANIFPFSLTAQEREDLLSFLHTLTDTVFVQEPAYGNPFSE